MKVTYANGGGIGDPPKKTTAVSPEEQAMMNMLLDPMRNPNMTGRVENTFGPIDYIAGTFPIGRVLAPYAARVMNALGLGEDAGVNLAKQAFSNRFGIGAMKKEAALNKPLMETATEAEMMAMSPYSGLNQPTTQELLGIAKAAPPSRIQGIGGGATARQAELVTANEMEGMAVDELINKFLNDPILMKDRKAALQKAAFYDEPFSVLEQAAIESAESMVDQFGHVIDPRVHTNRAGKRYLAKPPSGGKDINFPQSRIGNSPYHSISPQQRMDDAVRVVKDVEGDVLEQLNRAYRRQGQ